LALAGFGLLLGTPACRLVEADVVSRSPDLAPAATNPPQRDAADGGPLGGDASFEETTAPDGKAPAKDGRAAADLIAVAGRGDALDAPGADGELAGADGAQGGEAGERCQDPALVFCDDFENGSAAWTATGGGWAVTYDTMSTQPNALFGPSAAATSKVWVAQAAWQDMTVEARVRVLSFGQPSLSNRAEVYARYQDGAHLYAVSLRGDGKLGLGKNGIAIGNTASVAEIQNQWHTLRVRVSGQPGAIAIEGYLDGRMLATATDPGADAAGESSAAGTVGLGVYGETLAAFDDVKVSAP
jgi:hypothetical protein